MSRMADRGVDSSMPVKDHGSFVYHAPSDADIQGKVVFFSYLCPHIHLLYTQVYIPTFCIHMHT